MATVAAREAVMAALERLGDAKASYGFVFASPRHDLSSVLAGAREAAAGVEIIACTTAGEISEGGLVHGGVSALLVASDSSTAKAAFAERLRSDPLAAATALLTARAVARDGAPPSAKRHATTVLFTDGLSGTGERLVGELNDRAQGSSQIVGGAAGDEGKFKVTHVGAGAQAAGDAVAALHVFGAAPWGVGVNHGLRSTSKQMRVTAAEGNVIYELDGQPAFSLYQRHARARGVELTRENASQYLIGNELGIHFFDTIARARAPLAVGADGSLSCAAAIPKGSMVSILDGDPMSMVDAARSAAKEARDNLGGREPAAVLLFDCICRGMILKDGFQREIDAVRSVFGDVPLAGFLTYGEIARYQGKLDGWHNATAVVV
ncbi:MAG TPA: FIST N-terminal domain-containing protein, partial [Polyangiaceae bacterium]|nr:FIST N-terminal domain-containing protein [Polyangiaceae bacterium]